MGTAALNRAARDLRANASNLLPAESPRLYRLAQEAARETVEATAALPPLPQKVWSAADPQVAALEVGAEMTYLEMQRLQRRYGLAHDCGAMCRAVGGLGAQTILPNGVPGMHGFQFRRWDLAAAGAAETRRLQPPLRLRYAVDHGWEPGLYLASDISANPVPDVAPKSTWRNLTGWLLEGSKTQPIEVG